MTPYQKIFDAFLLKIEDLDLARLDPASQQAMLVGWLDAAIGFLEEDSLQLTHDYTDRNDELAQFNVDLDNREIQVLALYMVVAWYEPKVNSLEHTTMMYGSKDEKWDNKKDHYKAVSDIQEKYRKRARKYIRNYSTRNNSYLQEDSTE